MDPMTVYGLGAGLNALGSFIGGKSQSDSIDAANRQNEHLTRLAWDRDDTAVQRRAQDMIKAGVNPALAAGSAAGTSSPIPMQASGSGGAGQAMQAAGQSVSAGPTVEQSLKRQAAATLQSEASAALTGAQAKIAEHDYQKILDGQDPRDKTPMMQMIKLGDRLLEYLQNGALPGKVLEVGKKGAKMVEDEMRNQAGDFDTSRDYIMRRGLTPQLYEQYKRLPKDKQIELYRRYLGTQSDK